MFMRAATGVLFRRRRPAACNSIVNTHTCDRLHLAREDVQYDDVHSVEPSGGEIALHLELFKLLFLKGAHL